MTTTSHDTVRPHVARVAIPRTLSRLFLAAACTVAALAAGCSGDSTTPQTPTAPTAPTTPTVSVTAIAVIGASTLTAQDATTQFTATATLSNGTSEDRTSAATWQSDNAAVATVSAQGLVRAVANGTASITAILGDVRGSRPITITMPRRTPDPAAGQRLPMPDIQAFVRDAASARPDLLGQSCDRGLKYVTNPWLDYMVDRLRTLDTRWGYNAKPNRTAADNNGVPVVVAGDEIAYHFGSGPDQGSPDVYLIDILQGHCGPTPSLTYRVFTGEEPGRWTSAGRF